LARALETYDSRYDAESRVVCMYEQLVQLIGQTRDALPATRQHAERMDYEDERAGLAAVFMLCQPSGGWREASAARRRTGHWGWPP